MNDVKQCINFIDRKNYVCSIGIVESFQTNKRYNCRKFGACACYKSIKEHEEEVKRNKEKWEKETYERLKKKFKR